MLSIGIIAAFVVACRDVSAPEPALRIETSESSYVLGGTFYGLVIPATVTNIGSRPIDLAGCLSSVLSLPERWIDGHWEDQSFAGCGNIGLRPVRLNPGESIPLDARVRVVGPFRLRVPVFVDSTHQVPSAETSPTFNIF